MATAATAPPRLVEKKNSKSRVWYFEAEADDQGLIIDSQKKQYATGANELFKRKEETLPI